MAIGGEWTESDVVNLLSLRDFKLIIKEPSKFIKFLKTLNVITGKGNR